VTGTTTHPAWEPDYAVPPGETLSETLEELGMTQRELAQRTDLTPQTINLIVKGVDPITPDTANRLELVTGVPASLWNNLEKRYQEHRSMQHQRIRLGEYYGWIRAMIFPVAELRKRGHLPGTQKREIVVESLFRFLGIASPDAWERAYGPAMAAFRRCKSLKDKPGITTAWLRLAELDAAKVDCEPFSAQRFRQALDFVRTLTNAEPAEFVPRMRQECAASGVALVFVPEFKGGGINGAARWLSPEKAMIALNNRGKYADIFWFTFFHEAGHILKHGKRQVFIDTGKEHDEREEEANRFATDLLIPSEKAGSLAALGTALEIRRFADDVGVNPGIVVGQLAHKGTIPFWRFKELRRKLEWTEE
jgi:HTH-type transcriptional regulator/antitoxin HigA